MADGKERLIKLYGTLVKDGYALPEYSLFEKDMADSNNLKKLHGTLTKDGYELPDEVTFRSDMGYVQEKKKDVGKNWWDIGRSGGLMSGAKSAATGLSGGPGLGTTKTGRKVDGVETVTIDKDFQDTLPEAQADIDRRKKDDELYNIQSTPEFKKDPIKELNRFVLGKSVTNTEKQRSLGETRNKDIPVQPYDEFGLALGDIKPSGKTIEGLANAYNIESLQDAVKEQMFHSVQSARDWIYSNEKKGQIDEKNETDKIAKDILDDYQLKKEIIASNGGDIPKSAFDYYATKDHRVKAIKDQGGNLPKEAEGLLTQQFLNDKRVQELAEENADFNRAYTTEKFNFRQNFPELWTKDIVQKIAQGREDYEENNPVLNFVGVASSDRVMERLYDEGKVDEHDMKQYEEKIRPLIAINAQNIPTTGLIENTFQSAVKGIGDIPKGIYDLTGVHNLITSKGERAYDDLSEESNYVGVKAKGFFRNVTQATGHLAGVLVPIAGGSKILKVTNLLKNPNAANQMMMGLAFYHDLYKEAERNNPGGGYLNQLQALVQSAIFAKINPTFGQLSKSIVGETTPAIRDILNQLKTESITGTAAKEAIVNTVLSKIPQAAKATLKTSSEMAFATGLSDVVGGIFSGKFDADQTIQNMAGTFESMMFGTPLLNLLITPGAKRNVGKTMYGLTENPEVSRKRLETSLKDKPEYAKEILENFDHAVEVRKLLDEMPDLKPEQKEQYLVTEVNKKILENKVKNSPSKILNTKDEKQVKELEIEQQMITDPEMGNQKAVEELYNNDLLPKGTMESLEVEGKFSPQKVGGVLKELAQQANNLDANWQPHKGEFKMTKPNVPDLLIKLANERWEKEIEAAQPKESKVSVIMPGEMGKGEIVTTKPIITPEGIATPIEKISKADSVEAEGMPTDREFENAEQVVSHMDAETRLSNGERIFAAHEMGGEPIEIRNVGELKAYAPDQLIAIQRKENPFAKQADGQEKIEYEEINRWDKGGYDLVDFNVRSGGEKIGFIEIYDNKNLGYRFSSVELNKEQQGKGVGGNIYRDINKQSVEKTGKTLWTRKKSINEESERVWKSLVKSGEAEETKDGYRFKSSLKPKADEAAIQEPKTADLEGIEKGVTSPRYGKADENIPGQENKGTSDNTLQSGEESPEKLNKRYKRVTDENDFVDPYDVAVKYFADGGKINPSELERVFGGKGDKGARISLMKNNAGTVKQIAHHLWESDQTGRFEDTHYIDAVESALRNFPSQSAMKKDLADRFDLEGAYEKYMVQKHGKEAIDIVEKLTEEEINHILELEADKEKSAELEKYIDDVIQKTNTADKQSNIPPKDKEQSKGEANEDKPGAGKEPPKPPKEDTGAIEGSGEGRKELDKLANNIPDSGKVAEYMSKDTIEKYTGELPTNDQTRGVQELEIALNHGEKIIEKAKEVFGNDYAEKTLEYIDQSAAGVSNKALMYVSLENALGREKVTATPERAVELTKQQALVYEQSQKFARENSLALNYQKLRKIAKAGYDIDKVTDNFFSSEEIAAKRELSKAVEADADAINKEAEAQEVGGITKEMEKLVQEGVEKEVTKLYEALPKTKREQVDKTIKALEEFQKKIRSKAYSSIVPIPILDAGISVIKNAIKIGANIVDAVELGIKYIKEKYGKDWEKENEFRKDALEAFKEKKEVEFKKPTKDIVKEALIEKGFGREIIIKGEKKQILDWKKLAGAAGTVSKIRENVNSVLQEKGLRGLSDAQKGMIKEDFIKEYIDLRTSVIEKSQNELARRNKETVTPDQKSAAKKLAELYTYGLFEKEADAFENTLNKALGAKVSEQGFNDAREIAKALETIYSNTFKGVRLNDVSAKAAIERLEDKLRVLLFREAKSQGNFNLKAANVVRTFFEVSQTMLLNNLKQAFENPFSGLQQHTIERIDAKVGGESNKALADQRRSAMKTIYKDMVLNGGITYGKVESQFVNRQHLDDYVNKLSDRKMYHAIASAVTGKATLNAMDAMFKASITEKKFVGNLLRIMSHPTNPKRMSKEDALKFVTEKLTGQTFKDARVTAKEIIEKINTEAKTELIPANETQIDRFANDIVKASLEMGGKITKEQIEGAYNAAYKAAGLGLGHEANNMLSSTIKGYSAKLEGDINRAIKEKEWNRAAMLTYKSVLFRNVLNPFVGGGTNWLVLKLEKTGLGLVTGLAYRFGSKRDFDLSTELGQKRMEARLYNQSRYKDNFMRGLTGGMVSLLGYGIFRSFVDEDDYRKWSKENPWASRYLNTVTPEQVLLHNAIESKQIRKYAAQSFNKNDAFSKSEKLIKSLEYFAKGDARKGFGALGEGLGSMVHAPLPWRLVRDGNVLYQGITGQDPYHGNYKPSEGFISGYLQGGFIEWLGLRPLPEQDTFGRPQREKREQREKRAVRER